MKLPGVCEFLESLPGAISSTNGSQVMVPCFECDGPDSSRPHLSIKLDVEPGEPMLFRCFRASCALKPGVLTTEQLRRLGCRDDAVLRELVEYNATVDPGFERRFTASIAEDLALANLPRGNAEAKLNYLVDRLGIALGYDDLKDLKIQLSLLEMLRVNDIRNLATSSSMARMLDVYCVGFVSAWGDYLICRDVTPDMKTGKRYYNYRLTNKSTKDGSVSKIYIIPGMVEILNPRSTEINVAEGPFSILGAKFNTGIGGTRPNSIWAANCGSEYENTIIRICKQWGFLKVRINIWSDSEIGLGKYRKLLNDLSSRLDIRSFDVYYNTLREDFGYPRNLIRVRKVEML